MARVRVSTRGISPQPGCLWRKGTHCLGAQRTVMQKKCFQPGGEKPGGNRCCDMGIPACTPAHPNPSTVPFEASVHTQSCLTFCDPMNCSLPGSSVQGILQARILEWVDISFFKGSSHSRDEILISCLTGRGIIYHECHLGHWQLVLNQSRVPLLLVLLYHFLPRISENPMSWESLMKLEVCDVRIGKMWPGGSRSHLWGPTEWVADPVLDPAPSVPHWSLHGLATCWAVHQDLMVQTY